MNFQAGTEGYDYYPLCRNLLRIGKLFFDAEDYDEAAVWYYNAAFETASILDVHTSGNIPLNGLADCYEKSGNAAQAEEYRNAARQWQLPDDNS